MPWHRGDAEQSSTGREQRSAADFVPTPADEEMSLSQGCLLPAGAPLLMAFSSRRGLGGEGPPQIQPARDGYQVPCAHRAAGHQQADAQGAACS